MVRCLLAVTLFSALICGVSRAGEARRSAAEPNPMEAMSIEELRAYQGYFYASGGRDPMIMRFPTDLERGLAGKSGPKKAPTLEEQESLLRGWLFNITEAIKAQDYESALKVSAEAISIIDNEWPPLKSEHTDLIIMNEAIRSYARLAGRLKNKQDITKEFNALSLRVDGIVWSPLDAKAVINGRTHSAGELLIQERKQGDLRVELIEEHDVVFQYRGMRFRLPVEMYAPLIEPDEK